MLATFTAGIILVKQSTQEVATLCFEPDCTLSSIDLEQNVKFWLTRTGSPLVLIVKVASKTVDQDIYSLKVHLSLFRKSHLIWIIHHKLRDGLGLETGPCTGVGWDPVQGAPV